MILDFLIISLIIEAIAGCYAGIACLIAWKVRKQEKKENENNKY